jgi:hypothetical protein
MCLVIRLLSLFWSKYNTDCSVISYLIFFIFLFFKSGWAQIMLQEIEHNAKQHQQCNGKYPQELFVPQKRKFFFHKMVRGPYYLDVWYERPSTVEDNIRTLWFPQSKIHIYLSLSHLSTKPPLLELEVILYVYMFDDLSNWSSSMHIHFVDKDPLSKNIFFSSFI